MTKDVGPILVQENISDDLLNILHRIYSKEKLSLSYHSPFLVSLNQEGRE